MLRSLFSGISGLSNHLTMLDVVGSNIANVNTIGYKSSRVTFRELLTQTVRGATRPVDGSYGGTNPAQVGLGSVVQSIDPTFTQGNLQNTGKITDLAIEGNGFFVVSDGASRYYTRAGTFTFDGLGQLVSSGTGYVVQGIMADDDGSIDFGRALENIRLGDDLVTPALATETLVLRGNLDADADAVGTIMESRTFFATARGADLMTDLSSETGQPIRVPASSNINVSFNVGATNHSYQFTVAATSTLNDFIAALNGIAPGDATFSLTANGAIQVLNTGGTAITNLLVTDEGGGPVVGFSDTIPPATTDMSDELRGYARATDLLENLYNETGQKLSFNAGDEFAISGTMSGTNVSRVVTFVPGSTTLGDIASEIDGALGISNSTGVFVNSDGQIELHGDPGAVNGVNKVALTMAVGSNTPFTTNFDFVTTQQAEDADSWRTTANVFDSLGRDFRVGMTYTKRTGTNLWDWSIEVPSGVSILQGGTGTVGFGSDGLLSSFTFTDSSGALLIDPGNGAEVMRVELDPGSFNSLEGLIQFEGVSTATAKDFDGHGAGTLQAITINKAGVIVGQFTNGINRSLAQVALSEFNNPAGLLRLGNNMYGVSSNTGPETIAFVGANASGSIAPGTLEMSNVDLSAEFTQMIIAQRGFQANARVISTGDEMLSDLVTLKR